MRDKLRRLWPIVKYLLGAALLVCLAYQFRRELTRPELWQRSLQRPGWLVVAALLYLLGIGFSAYFWRRLLVRLGTRPNWPAVVRAYYLGQLGKYVPGKAVALVMRATMIRGAGVGGGLATLTTFYEVLLTMASGALLAVVLFAALAPPTTAGIDFNLLWRIVRLEAEETSVIDRTTSVALSLLVMLPVLLPVLPPVFNRVVHHVSLPFRGNDTPAPAIPWVAFLEGLALTACGWLLLGASTAVVLYAGSDKLPDEIPYLFLGRVSAIMGLAYVAGFVSILLPGGIGVREIVLTLFLTPEVKQLLDLSPEDARAQVVHAVVVLRLVWFAAELAVGAVVYWLRATPAGGQPITDNGQGKQP